MRQRTSPQKKLRQCEVGSAACAQLRTCKVSNVEQPAVSSTCNSLRMNDEIQILAVELDGKDGLVVTFSDGTTGGYVIEELLALRPIRERMKIRKKIPMSRK
jgi:hypothetical protein